MLLDGCFDQAREPFDPWIAGCVVERHALSHPRDVFRQMKVVSIDEIGMQCLSQQPANDRLATAGDAHHDDDVGECCVGRGGLHESCANADG